jgi:RNA polymerase sigma-70 factor (ECF subfamily)
MHPADAIALPAATLGEALVEPPGTFEELVGEHQAMVFSLAFHTLRNRGLAEDVAQEAFLRLSGHLPRLQSRRHALFWLRQVTCRLCIDELRRWPARSLASLEDVGELGVDPPGGDLLLEEQLRRRVAELPLKARLAVVLRYQEDLDPAEIAALLKEPLPTVKSRLQRALAQLREGLAGPEGGRR